MSFSYGNFGEFVNDLGLAGSGRKRHLSVNLAIQLGSAEDVGWL